MAATDERDRRNFFRITARIPIRLRELDAQEAASVAMEIRGPVEELPPLADPAMAAVLQRLERKLDLLLAHLDPDRPRPLGHSDVRNVSLSAAGFGVEWNRDGAEEPAEMVLVELQLPGVPGRDVRAVAHPVAGPPPDPSDKHVLQAFAFDAIAEADRDAIVRFSHDVQRSELRERSLERRGT